VGFPYPHWPYRSRLQTVDIRNSTESRRRIIIDIVPATLIASGDLLGNITLLQIFVVLLGGSP
jgi:hypothetical protein